MEWVNSKTDTTRDQDAQTPAEYAGRPATITAGTAAQRCSHSPRGISGRSAYGPKCRYRHFGPVCVKFSGYFPYTGRLILNGNEYAKRQAAKAGIGFVPLDNAFAAVDDVAAVQAICDGLDEGKITALAARLLADPAVPVHRGRHRGRLPAMSCPCCRRSSP